MATQFPLMKKKSLLHTRFMFCLNLFLVPSVSIGLVMVATAQNYPRTIYETILIYGATLLFNVIWVFVCLRAIWSLTQRLRTGQYLK